MSALDSTTTPSAAAAQLADATRVGAVHLTVSELDRSVAYYERSIGLRVLRREGAVATMGAGEEELVVLHEQPGARPAGRHAGLYHFALLFPSREELSRAALRLAATRTPIDGASDHGTHEAIYLPDPDGNGIELAADRPRDRWPDITGPAGYGGGPAPLDVQGLLAVAAAEPVALEAAPGLTMGHVHLHVADLDAATRFYRDGLGFDVMTTMPTAVFVAAGGYHHHVGFNVWRGVGVPPAPADAVGLRHWTLLVPDASELAAVRARLDAIGARVEVAADGALLARDPAGIAVRVVAA
jgi:catechol 2,3-dioxygenase